MDLATIADWILIGLFVLMVVIFVISVLQANGHLGAMSDEEADFADKAYKIKNRGVDAKRSQTAYDALVEYETRHDMAAANVKLVSEHIYQEDMQDIRENYETLVKEEWEEKADKILDKFYALYAMITDPTFKDVERAYRSKNRCIRLWQQYFYSIPTETGVWFDAKTHMQEYLEPYYDDCMYSHETLEKKLSRCIEEMKPEYQRKMALRKRILDIVAERESIMRADLVKIPFEGCTKQEVEYCIKELVDNYRLVSLKIADRYFISLSDKEKAKRAGK